LQIRLNSSATHRRSNSQRSALPRSSRRRPPLFWDTSPYGRSQRIISTLPSGISFIRSRQSPCIRLINLSSPYNETYSASDTRCRYILHCHDMKIGRAQSELQSRENLVCRLLLEKKKLYEKKT